MTTRTVYDDKFFDYINVGARRSAAIVVPFVLRHFPAKSVCDIGCGQGAWLQAWLRCGVSDVAGVDGGYVNQDRLLFQKELFVQRDLGQAFDLGRLFDLVVSLEVGEHISPQSTETFIDNICRHGDAVLFSAAPEGQGGTQHINERSYDFWRDAFCARGYRSFDFVRGELHGTAEIEPWYRYNTLFFAKPHVVAKLSEHALSREIALETPVPDWSPISWRARKAIVRTLPAFVVDRMVEAKHRYTLWNFRRATTP